MKTGIFGGTFDPPHVGHLIVAERIRESAGLDRILFVPSFIPPHKQEAERADAIHRLAMTRLSIAETPQFEVSSCEIDRGGVSYTLDTLTQLHGLFTTDEFSLIIGMDNLGDFDSWKEPATILKLASLIVMTRPGSDQPTQSGQVPFTVYPVPQIGISSREIRSRVLGRKSIRFLVAPAVAEYIKNHNLYQRHND